jgi:hypothetical protein
LICIEIRGPLELVWRTTRGPRSRLWETLRYQGQLRDVEQLFEEESRQRQEISEKAGLAERKANALQGSKSRI